MKHKGNPSRQRPVVPAHDTGLPGVGDVVCLCMRSSGCLTVPGRYYLSEQAWTLESQSRCINLDLPQFSHP